MTQKNLYFVGNFKGGLHTLEWAFQMILALNSLIRPF